MSGRPSLGQSLSRDICSKYFFATAIALVAACFAACLLPAHVQAATYTWQGSTSADVDDSGNWSGLSGSFLGNDTAYWDGLQAGALNLSLTGASVINPAAPGVNLYIDSGQTSPVTINGSNAGSASTMRLNSITINPNAGAFTLGSASLTTTTNVTLGGGGTIIGSAMTAVNLVNNSSGTATLGANIVFNNSSAASHGLGFSGSGAWALNAPWCPPMAESSGWRIAAAASSPTEGSRPAAAAPALSK